MRGSAIAASLALSILALSAAPVFAQAAPEQAKPAQTPPKPVNISVNAAATTAQPKYG